MYSLLKRKDLGPSNGLLPSLARKKCEVYIALFVCLECKQPPYSITFCLFVLVYMTPMIPNAAQMLILLAYRVEGSRNYNR